MGKKICLSMIVKNESAIIVRMLDSLEKIIDYICIEDTGSEDNTIELIQEWGKSRDIPTVVTQYTFVDFGLNRSHAFDMAVKNFPQSDYFLLSDADFVWDISQDFNKELLTSHKYMVEQSTNDFIWKNIRLISNKRAWKCFGVTHEYWDKYWEKGWDTSKDKKIREGTLRTLKIIDKSDGGCRSDKLERDKRLLIKAIDEFVDEDNPAELKTRYPFYLAETLHNLKEYDEAVKYYKIRIELSGYHTGEIFYSAYKIGKIYEALYDDKKEDEFYELAEEYYKKAWTLAPTRAESLYELAKMHRVNSRHQKCYDICQIGRKINLNPAETFFVTPSCYNGYRFDYELSIVCYYLDKKDEGKKALLNAIQNKEKLNKSERNCLKSNADFYN